MRLELLPFIDESIARHQEFLENMDKVEELQQKERQRQEQILIDKGEKAKAIKTARKMLARNIGLAEIIADTELTEDEIKAIR